MYNLKEEDLKKLKFEFKKSLINNLILGLYKENLITYNEYQKMKDKT